MYVISYYSKRLFVCLLVIYFVSSASVSAQITVGELNGGNLNAINTSVPFVTITPDSRGGALGDAGVATSPDVNSQHWNMAKYAFMDEMSGVSTSFTPWLRSIISDINMAYLVGYYKPADNQAISASLRYFSLGEIVFTDIDGYIQGQYNPNELAIDAGYSRLFSDKFSGGVTFRFIYSNLTSGQELLGEPSKAGLAVATDLGCYFEDRFSLAEKEVGYAWGITLTNMGTPISYTDGSKKIPIPSTFRFGGRLDYSLDEYNTLSYSLEFSKLMVPTPPIYTSDTTFLGYEDPASIVGGMFRSFFDAPGISYSDGSYSSVFREEMAELMISTGIEYWYRKQFAIRAGYFHEASVKGNRKFISAGVGLQLNVFSIDLSYLVPTNGMDSPLANTLRFTLGFEFGN